MKKQITLFICIILLLFPAGCGKEKTVEDDVKVTLGNYREVKEKISGMDRDVTITDDMVTDYMGQMLDYHNQTAEETLYPGTLTDSQVKDAFKMESVKSFRDFVRETLEKEEKESRQAEIWESTSDELLLICSVEPFPEKELKNRMEVCQSQSEKLCMDYYGVSFEEFLKQAGFTAKQYEEELRQRMEETIRLEHILSAIGDKEGITYEEDEWKEYVTELMEAYGYENESELYKDQDEEALRAGLKINKTAEWFMSPDKNNKTGLQ